MKTPKSINKLIESFEKLPGIGPKTAQRLTFYLLHVPLEEVEKFATALVELKTNTKLCRICKNVGEDDLCAICSDTSRDHRIIAIVSSPLDVFALEKTNFKGSYHVLHGLIDPLNNIGPEEIFIGEFIRRLRDLVGNSSSNFGSAGLADSPVEIILATNTSMEGESTAMYISKLIRESGFDDEAVKITRIARGLPVGGDIEYADDITLRRALEGRGRF